MEMLMNIIDRIYSSSHFTTVLLCLIGLLVLLFIIVLVLGIKDSRKELNKDVKEEEVKDITFEPIEVKEEDNDVTFEIPTITRNLEDFKNAIEEELMKEDTPVVEVHDNDQPIKLEEVIPVENVESELTEVKVELKEVNEVHELSEEEKYREKEKRKMQERLLDRYLDNTQNISLPELKKAIDEEKK